MSDDPRYSSPCATCADYMKRSKAALPSFHPYPQAWSLDIDLLCLALNNKEEKVAKLSLEHGAEVLWDREDDVNVKSHKTVLHCVVEMNDVEMTKSLLQKNVDVEARSQDDSTPLHIAARMGNTEIAEVLLNYGADANSVCSSMLGKLLHIAVEQGKAALVEMLLRRGTNMNASVKDEGTLFVLAAKRRFLDVVKVLLNKGADIDARDKDNENILRFAVENRVFPLIELILEAHSDPRNNLGCFYTAVDGSMGETQSKIVKALLRYGFGLNSEHSQDRNLLHNAACRGYSKIVEYLLNSGTNFNVESRTEHGAMPLHSAVQHNQIEIARLLIKNNANVNAKDGNENTPLHYALRNISVDMTKLLLAHGADLKGEPNVVHKATLTMSKDFVEMLFQHEPTLNVNRVNKLGMTVLYRSIIPWRYIDPNVTHSTSDTDTCIGDIATILLTRGADVNARANDGTTALHVAAQQGYRKVVELLLEYKADVNFVGKKRETPLHCSARNGNEKIVKILLDAGAMVNAKRTNGATALHVAIKKGHAKTVKLLMENGADIADRTKSRANSLHIAAAHRSAEVLEILLNVFEDIECRKRDGLTSLHIAALHGHPRNVRLLLDHGSDINLLCHYGQTPLTYAIDDESSDDNDDHDGDNEDDDYDEDDEDDDSDDYDEDDEDDEDDDSADSDDYDKDGYKINEHSCHDAAEDAYNYDEYESRYDEVCEILRRHIITMIAMNRFVSDKNLRCINSIIRNYKNLQDNCIREIECMRQKKIGVSNVSYYDVLTNDMNRLAVYTRNKDIVDALETGEHKNMFWVYLNMLEIRFEKGQKRASLLDQSLKSLGFLTGYALPDLLTGEIFNYLSNEDLGNLIKAGLRSEIDS